MICSSIHFDMQLYTYELIALVDASKEAEWLKNLLVDIPLWKNPSPAILINCDNKATIYRVENKTYNGKSRHVSLRHQSIRQLLKHGVITVDYIESSKNLAYPLTCRFLSLIVLNVNHEP